LDAELLLAHILDWSRARVLAERSAPLSQPQQAALRALIARRAALEPVAYLIGHKEFYGLDFLVDHHVLIPRPETELLVDRAIAIARRMTTDHRPPLRHSSGQATIGVENREPKTESQESEPRSSKSEPRTPDYEPITQHTTHNTQDMSVVGRRPPALSGSEGSVIVADIGTGSGCIAVALAVHLSQALVYAADISAAALDIARRNVKRHGVEERVRLIEGDLLEALPQPVDVLVSNPPYTILSEIDEGVRRYEPHLGLDGGAEGLAIYRRLLAAAPAKLRHGGAVLLEIGATQGAAVAELAREHFPAARIRVYADLAGLDRVVGVEL
jgi:methylase of polypeptide subunit release factors